MTILEFVDKHVLFTIVVLLIIGITAESIVGIICRGIKKK